MPGWLGWRLRLIRRRSSDKRCFSLGPRERREQPVYCTWQLAEGWFGREDRVAIAPE